MRCVATTARPKRRRPSTCGVAIGIATALFGLTLETIGYRADMAAGAATRDALRLVSTGGNITFVNRTEFIFRDVALGENAG